MRPNGGRYHRIQHMSTCITSTCIPSIGKSLTHSTQCSDGSSTLLTWTRRSAYNTRHQRAHATRRADANLLDRFYLYCICREWDELSDCDALEEVEQKICQILAVTAGHMPDHGNAMLHFIAHPKPERLQSLVSTDTRSNGFSSAPLAWMNVGEDEARGTGKGESVTGVTKLPFTAMVGRHTVLCNK